MSVPKNLRPLRNICIANRGEIVQRVNHTANKLGIKTTSLYTDPDRELPSATSNFNNVRLGESPQGYIDINKIVSAAKSNGCDSIHPGYGFLSENAQFAQAVRDAGLIFIGPPQQAIQAMGAKDRSKEIMEAAGVPCVPGYHGENQDADFLAKKADEITYPVLIKAVLGGGGKGMRIVNSPEDFAEQLKSAKSESAASFGDDRVLIEKYITTPRHIEVQVFGDRYGNVVALGERDCSVQRRHQKVLEESPAPGLSEEIRQDLWEKARAAASAVGYEGAGTVEFIFDNDTNKFYFMEMNTRLQVEHPVTEQVVNEDLVEWQLLVAAGFPLPKKQEEIKITGHAFEARIYCEDPFNNFMPSSGQISHLREPTDLARLDFTFKQGSTVSPLYDPMIGKLIVKADDRQQALDKLNLALQKLEIVGPTTNIEFVKRIASDPDFETNSPQGLETGFIPKRPHLFEDKPIDPKVYAQAALGVLLSGKKPRAVFGLANGWVYRTVEFEDGTAITVNQTGLNTYNIMLPGGKESFSVTADYLPSERQLHVEFPDSQHINTVVVDQDSSHVFHDGVHYTLKQVQPKWLQKALEGVAGDGHSVVAPMPCTIARVSIEVGQEVKKNDPLLVILSMKMETTIRSPQDGIVKRIPGVGAIFKQGQILVEFEETTEETS